MDYMRGGLSPFMFGWRPVLRDPRDDVMRSWTDATARTIDALHNSGILSGAIDQAVVNILGAGLRLNASPDVSLFHDQAAANAWSRREERRFSDWLNSPWACDLGGRYTGHQLCAQAMRSHFASGEMVGTLPYLKREGNSHGSKVNLLPSSRLAQGGSDAAVVQGVRLDRNGAPTGYVFTNRDNTGRFVQDVELRARDPEGRPLVFHIFEGAPTATRGLTPLAPVLQVVRQIDQLQNAKLTSQLMQAIFAASIESDAPTEEVLEALQSTDEQDGIGPDAPTGSGFDTYMSSKFKWYGNTKIDLGQFGKVFHAFPGEKLNFHSSKSPDADYQAFINMLYREVARCLGVTFEDLSLNSAGATYNSLSNETAAIYLITQYRRKHHAAPFMQLLWEAFLEEDVENGGAEFPGGMDAFLANRLAACRAEWIGPPRPPADEKKTAEANEVKLRNKVITRATWCAELGTNVWDVDDQEAQEAANRERLKLPPIVPVTNTTPNLPDGGRTGDDPPDEPGAGATEGQASGD
jgi:lambda family phage portal protein